METTFQDVKKLVREMCAVGYINKKAISDEQKILSPKITDMTLSLFTEIKSKTTTYTIQKNAELRKLNVDEDEISPSVLNFLKDNSNALHEVIGYFYFGKRNYYTTENQMFYLEVYSAYTECSCGIFVVSKSGKFWIVDEEKTDLSLVDYINNYFGVFPDDLRGRLERIFDNQEIEHDSVQIELNEISRELSKQFKIKTTGFRYGAIMFMDFLGWKGLWQSRTEENHLESVSKLINEIKDMVQMFTYELFPHTQNMEISKFISISDTIAIFTPKVRNCKEVDILELHARIAKYILENCVHNKYAIRGAISFGRYNTKDSIMIGPGIDECASWHETCDWIGVHLTPSAELKINTAGLKENTGLQEYKVPVKRGYPEIKYCVQWEVDDESFEKLTDGVQALLPEISSKYMNTYAYLHRKEGKNHG